MTRKRHNVIPLLSTRLTATASVALVLLIASIAAMAGIVMRNFSDAVRESVGFTVILRSDITASQTDAVRRALQSSPGISRIEYSSAQKVLERWQLDLGEDIEILAGGNPFSPEFEVNVSAGYASVDSIEIITAPLASIAEIDEIVPHTTVATELNATFHSLSLILAIVAAALLIISYVLISNTVRLFIYARRFDIHTMRLVGATAGFIRRPFLTANIVNGLLAGLIASVLLTGILVYCHSLEPRMVEFISPLAYAVTVVATIAGGIIICLIAALLATNKYLRQSYDEMFH
ncbi:MAG: permease-like cell division protein FtsX [Duncaniella sp.]|nr:permease-like cell division protein FtsX [Duncaniella sp.]